MTLLCELRSITIHLYFWDFQQCLGYNFRFQCYGALVCFLPMNIVDARKYNKLLSLIALLKIKTAISAGDVLK